MSTVDTLAGSGGIGRCDCGEYETCEVCLERHRRHDETEACSEHDWCDRCERAGRFAAPAKSVPTREEVDELVESFWHHAYEDGHSGCGVDQPSALFIEAKSDLDEAIDAVYKDLAEARGQTAATDALVMRIARSLPAPMLAAVLDGASFSAFKAAVARYEATEPSGD